MAQTPLSVMSTLEMAVTNLMANRSEKTVEAGVCDFMSGII